MYDPGKEKQPFSDLDILEYTFSALIFGPKKEKKKFKHEKADCNFLTLI